MALICNGYRLGHRPHRIAAGSLTTIYNGSFAYLKLGRTGGIRNLIAGNAITNHTTSLPTGSTHPYAWMLPKEGGGAVAHGGLDSEHDFSASASLGKNASAAISSSATLSALAGLIVSAFADLQATGGITNADFQAILNALADIVGTATINATMSGIANADADIESEVVIDAAMTGIANASADISSLTELSPETLAAAVWNAVASAYTDPGTMGEKLNDAGGAGNPWASLLVDNADPGTFGERVQKLLTVAKFLGLK